MSLTHIDLLYEYMRILRNMNIRFQPFYNANKITVIATAIKINLILVDLGHSLVFIGIFYQIT